MLHIEILVCKDAPVDGHGARAVAVEKVASLDHEAVDCAVEGGVLVAHWFSGCVAVFAGAELAKVFGGAGHAVGVEFEFHAARGDSADGNVKEDDGVGVRQLLHVLDRLFVRHLVTMLV